MDVILGNPFTSITLLNQLNSPLGIVTNQHCLHQSVGFTLLEAMIWAESGVTGDIETYQNTKKI